MYVLRSRIQTYKIQTYFRAKFSLHSSQKSFPNVKARNRHRILLEHFDVLSITSCQGRRFHQAASCAAFSGLMDEFWKSVTRDRGSGVGAPRVTPRTGADRVVYEIFMETKCSTLVYVHVWENALPFAINRIIKCRAIIMKSPIFSFLPLSLFSLLKRS